MSRIKAGMYEHPYPYMDVLPTKRPFNRVHYFAGGTWKHQPLTLAKEAFKGGNLATTVAQGNYMTRNFRQKPLVTLQKAEHVNTAPIRKKILKAIDNRVTIPTVSQRRTKDYSGNKILTTSKAMPYRKKTKATRAKKSRRVYRKRRLPPLAIPRSRVVRMRCVANSGTTTSGSGLNTLFLKANSLNDPTGLFGTGLPLGLDQWAGQYQKYIVLGSKLKVRFIANAVNTGAVQVGLHLADNNTALSSSAHYKELPLTRSKLVTTQRDITNVSMNYAGKRFWRINNIKDDSEQEAVFSTTPGDPTDLAYYHIFVQDINGAQNASVDIQVEMEFIVLLTDPINLAQSSL